MTALVLGLLLLAFADAVFLLYIFWRDSRSYWRQYRVRKEMRQVSKAPLMPFRPADVGTPMFLVDGLQIDRSYEID